MIELLHTDCMEYMRGLPDKAFDLAIVDPPYRDAVDNAPTKQMRALETHGKMRNWSAKPGTDFFYELRRVSVNQIVWGGNNFIEFLSNTNCFIFWNKKNPVRNYSDGELAWTSFTSPARCLDLMYFGAHGWDADGKIHPTQKPVALYRWLLKNYAKPGDKILDTHLGSGSIAIACDIEGFDLVATEIDADYIAGARKRLADHQAQPRLFDAPKDQGEQLTMDA